MACALLLCLSTAAVGAVGDHLCVGGVGSTERACTWHQILQGPGGPPLLNCCQLLLLFHDHLQCASLDQVLTKYVQVTISCLHASVEGSSVAYKSCPSEFNYLIMRCINIATVVCIMMFISAYMAEIHAA